MNQENDREKRWLAYHLGESAPGEREKIEQEFKTSPKEAEDFKRFILELTAWAKEEVPHTPLLLEDLGIDPSYEKGKTPRIGFFPAKWFWGFAAAALILFALSQTSFSIRMGDFVISWGRDADGNQVSQLSKNLSLLSEDVRLLRQNAIENQTRIQNVALRNTLLERNIQTAFTQLVYNQQLETRARYNDLQKLLRISDESLVNPEVTLDPYGGEKEFEGQPFLNKSSNHSDPSLQKK